MQYVEKDDIQQIMTSFLVREMSEFPLVIHHSGDLDIKKWKPALQRKHGEDWEIKGSEAMSKYSGLIYDDHTSYFRMVVENGRDKVRCWNHILGGSVDFA